MVSIFSIFFCSKLFRSIQTIWKKQNKEKSIAIVIDNSNQGVTLTQTIIFISYIRIYFPQSKLYCVHISYSTMNEIKMNNKWIRFVWYEWDSVK